MACGTCHLKMGAIELEGGIAIVIELLRLPVCRGMAAGALGLGLALQYELSAMDILVAFIAI